MITEQNEQICKEQGLAIINFNEMISNHRVLRNLDCAPSEDRFEATWNEDDQIWEISYNEADAYFEAPTLGKVVIELSDFLSSDETLESVGPATVCFANGIDVAGVIE